MLELIAVMAIIVTLAVTALPVMHSMGGKRSEMASRALLDDIMFARQEAMATTRTTWVRVDVANDRWTVLREQDEASGFDHAEVMIDPATGRPYEVKLDASPFYTVRLMAADIDEGDAIGFEWRGRVLDQTGAQLAETAEIVFDSGHRVRVEPETGYATTIQP